MREVTDPNVRPLREPDSEPTRGLKRWMLIAGVIVATGSALATLSGWGLLSTPWETQANAQAAHTKLQDGLDEMRVEQTKATAAVLEAITRLGEKLEPKRRR